MAWWPLLTLRSFTSSMSGREFIAHRKLAFHVLGSQTCPGLYFPAGSKWAQWFRYFYMPIFFPPNSVLTCLFMPAHLCEWPILWTDMHLCLIPNRAERHVSKESKTLSCPVTCTKKCWIRRLLTIKPENIWIWGGRNCFPNIHKLRLNMFHFFYLNIWFELQVCRSQINKQTRENSLYKLSNVLLELWLNITCFLPNSDKLSS